MFPVCIISQDWKRDLWWRNILVGDDENGYCSHFALTLGSSILPPTFFGSCPPNFNTLFFPFNFPLFYLFSFDLFPSGRPRVGCTSTETHKEEPISHFRQFHFLPRAYDFISSAEKKRICEKAIDFSIHITIFPTSLY